MQQLPPPNSQLNVLVGLGLLWSTKPGSPSSVPPTHEPYSEHPRKVKVRGAGYRA
jgi:hypothetical protein